MFYNFVQIKYEKQLFDNLFLKSGPYKIVDLIQMSQYYPQARIACIPF